MKVYFDTNVIVATLRSEHIHHASCYAAVDRVYRKQIHGCISAHGLVETYSVLTKTPFSPPVTTSEARQAIEELVMTFFEVIEVTTESHLAAIALCAKAGWRGGRIHDAVHIQAALQANCDLIYTWNLAEFHALAPDLADKIQTPPDPARRE